MSAFVALDIARIAAERYEIAAVFEGVEQPGRLCCLLGFDETAAKARRHVDDQADYLALPDWLSVLGAILERGGDAPWVSFDLTSELESWQAQDTTGTMAVITQLDAGELAALAMLQCEARTLDGFLAAAECGEAVARGLPTADAVARLWSALPTQIAALPYAVRNGLGELLEQSTNPLGAVWQAAAKEPPAEGDTRTIEAYLRDRCRELTPDPPGEEEPEPVERIDLAQVREVFEPDGPLAGFMPGFEARQGQLDMTAAVADCFNEGKCLLVEAGTGTGKSIAYLVPALLFALQSHTRVIVSTATKNLQDQLYAKDLPLLREALGWEFRIELAKGRSNYLCVEKLLREYNDAGLLPFDDQLFHLACLLGWAAFTQSGDLDELNGYLLRRYPRLESYARQVASDGETCTAATARGHPCFATIARRRAWGADILVVNHALALANSQVEVLPPYRYAVFDEAHNLEDIATEQFGLAFERRELLRLLREVAATRDSRALANRLRRELSDLPPEFTERVLEALTGVEQAASGLVEGFEAFGEALAGVVMQQLGRSVDELVRPERMRLRAEIYDGPVGQNLRETGDNVRQRIQEMVLGLTTVANELAGLRDHLPESEALQTAASARRNDWTAQSRTLDILLRLDDPTYVYWLEFVLRREAWEWRLRAAPIEAGEALAEHIYDQLEAVVLTSATLSVDGSFDYFQHRLGLDTESTHSRAVTLSVPSSFDYPQQVLLAQPLNIAVPQDERFDRHVARALDDIVRMLDGRTLVLFTARGAMNRIFEELAPRFQAVGIEPLCQSISGSRHVLADRFRRDEHSVLFGTRSFWEGIDIPGDALQCVVIVKLPFEVPDDPVFSARCEHLEAQGINAWTKYSVPQAVIRFKQGCGRLIRTAGDRGVVICLDRRLREKSYGRAFLRSLPGYTGVFEPWRDVKERVREWLEEPARATRRHG